MQTLNVCRPKTSGSTGAGFSAAALQPTTSPTLSQATEVVVFDIYRGAGIPDGFRSVAIGLNLQDVSRTLTDDDADAVVAQVVVDLKREFNATIRDK